MAEILDAGSHEGKIIVLVTGGNTGIGYQIIKSLCALKPSYQILMGCRDTSKGEAAIMSHGGLANVNPIQLDITDDESVDRCYKAIEQKFGRLDILINNAGTLGLDLSKQTGEAQGTRKMWTHVYSVNVISTGLLTQRLIPLLQRTTLPNQSAKIIFISSTCGSIGTLLTPPLEPFFEDPIYDSSKAALNMLTAFYTRIYPKWRVNSVCPGYRATGLNDAEFNEGTDPALGAVRAVELAVEEESEVGGVGVMGMDGKEGGTRGTFTNSEGVIPW